MINSNLNVQENTEDKGKLSGQSGEVITPWYRQFWPWFVIAFPATAVVAGVITIFIAFNNADSLVNDSYYRDGLAINQRLAQDVAATRLNLSAELYIDDLSGEVMINLIGDLTPPETIELLLLHPGDAKRDLSILLKRVSDNRYRADLEQLPQQRYYLRVQASADGEWRLNGEINFSNQTHLTLTHNALTK